jgi:hypothetical protein
VTPLEADKRKEDEMLRERPPIMVDCECSGTRPHLLHHAILSGAPTGYLCAACGQEVGVDASGLSLPHQHPDVVAMLKRGDFDV